MKENFKNRIEILDILRGFALCCIIFMNMANVLKMPFERFNQEVNQWMDILFLGKGYTIFSFLFGYGAYIFMQNAENKGYLPRKLFFQRLIILLLFGIVHQIVHKGEALSMYAVLGMLLLPFYNIKAMCSLLVSGAFILLSGFAMSQITMSAGMIFLGFGLSKIEFIQNYFTKSNTAKIGLYLTVSILLSIAGEYWIYNILGVQSNYYSKAVTLIGLVQSVSYVLFIAFLLLSVPSIKKILHWFSYMGRMAFTNYIMQTVFLLIMGWLMPNIDMVTAYWLCLMIVVIQLIYSRIYLTKIDAMGPLEKVWRKLTYSKFV